MPDPIDLSTTYLGLTLTNPLVPSAGPLSRDIGTVRNLEDEGAAAIVLFSLFEEEIEHEANAMEYFLDCGVESHAEATHYFPRTQFHRYGPDEYLEHLRRLKEAVGIPVIASLNGVTPGGWTRYARSMEEAGADALELNVYYIPTSPEMDGRLVEERYVEVLRTVRSQVKIPVALKLSPYFSALANMAKRFEEAGADGLVLFNRFYQPDVDLENLEVYPNLVLSNSTNLRLPLRWVAILHKRVHLSLAASSGIDRPEDVLKMVMVGADVTMLCSSLLRNGPRHLRLLLDGVRAWMDEHEYPSLDTMRGSMSHWFCSDPSTFERANYLKALYSYR